MDKKDKERFALNITEEWECRGMTMTHLSAISGVSVDTLRAIKSGETRPTEATCVKLCRALNVRPMEMIR